jgi:hypothetical protein
LRKPIHDKGSVLCRWDPTSKFLATVGANKRVHIHQRSGESFEEFALSSKKYVLSNSLLITHDGDQNVGEPT